MRPRYEGFQQGAELCEGNSFAGAAKLRSRSELATAITRDDRVRRRLVAAFRHNDTHGKRRSCDDAAAGYDTLVPPS